MKTNFLSKSIAMILTIALVAALIVPAASAAPSGSIAVQDPASPFAQYLESKYKDPDRVYSTDVRWWLGTAAYTTDTLREEIQALYDGGFRGVELCMQSASNNAPNETYAYGSPHWAYMWRLMMNELLDLGMGLYLTSGTNWATSNVPGLDPDSQQAMQVLAMSKQIVDPGQTITALARPGTTRATNKGRFIGAYAYKFDSQESRNVAGRYNYTRTAVIDDTMITLPAPTQGDTVYDQNVTWTAPADGQYVVFSYWSHGAYQTSSPGAELCYATNYFDVKGIEALREFWEANYLNDPVLNQKIMDGDVQLFMDSLEINPTGGITWWAEDIFEEFKARKGYDVFPYIFLVEGLPQVNAVYNAYFPPAQGSNDLADNENLREKIVNDWVDILTQLYCERMLLELKTWLNSVGIETRAQISYGRSFEITEPSMYVDYPEAEVFNQYYNIDIMRLHVAGGKLQNKVVSVENSTNRSNSSTTPQMHMEDAYYAFAAGIQRTVWHLWGANYGYGSPIAWPGNWAGMAGFTRFSTRNPNSVNYDEFNAHLGRVQQLMQTGKSRTDIGFIHNNWNQGIRFGGSVSLGGGGSPNQDPFTGMNWMLAHQGVYYRSTELQDNGYTYDYFSPKFLFDDHVSFNEATKTIEPAGYKALVLYQDWLDIRGAERILEWAKKGLPVAIMDGAAVRTTFNDGQDAKLAEIIAELKTLPSVRAAEIYTDNPDFDYFKPIADGYEDGLYEALQELGVRPYAEFIEPNKQLLTQSRIDDNGNMYLYAFNYCPNDYHDRSYIDSVKTLDHGINIQTEIKMDGMYIPYFIDAWSGEVTELTNYYYDNGQTVFPIDIDFDNIALFAFEAVNSEKLHIVSTDVESAYAASGGIALRATESGTYNALFSNGVSCQHDVAVPAPYDITDWDVTIESWTRNDTVSDLERTETLLGVTTVNTNTSTVKTPINVKLPTLTTWNNIPEVGGDVSGIGLYAATFNWDADEADGAYLDLGNTLASSIAVWINGKKVGGDVSTNPTKVKKNVSGLVDGQPVVGKDLYSGGVNQTKPIIDIGPYLVNGANEIVIKDSTDLTNVSLALGLISRATNRSGYWRYNIDNRAYGPSQAVLVPYVDTYLAYTLTVANGSGSGSYVIGENVTVAAGAAPAGRQFSEWVATGMELTEEQAGQNPLTFEMPDSYVTLTALYSPVAATPAPPPKGNYGGSQGKVESLVTPTPTPTPTPSEAPGEELGEEAGGESDGESSVEPDGESAPTPAQPSKPQSSMADIAPDYWAAEFIDGLMALGIVDGYPMPDGSREYRPENNITRLEMAKLIVASLELELIYDYDGPDTFADWFDVQEWGRPYMAAAIEAGIVLGSAEGDGLYLFPDDNIIREEMIAMSVRALGAEVPEGGECDAPDFDAVSEWAMDDVAFAVENEMINLRQGNVAPGSNATRAESAMILYKLLEYLGM